MVVTNGTHHLSINPIFKQMYFAQGWVEAPTEDEIHIPDNSESNSNENENEKVDFKTYSKRAFNGMSVDKILELAKERGYEITSTDKSEIVEQFLAQQGE